jgi:hypothetical protein
MSNLVIRRAQRSSAKPLIGLYSESNGGKTTAAANLARGYVGPTGKVVMIESESGRGEAIADLIPGGFDVISLDVNDGFSPQRYGEAISLAEKSGADALIIDSCSHEWEGVGGVLDMAATNQAAGKKGPIVWQQPKISHQKYFMGRILQTPIKLVILCMRAKYSMEEKVNNGKKDWVRSEELSPKQSEDILFEMFIHGWLDKEKHNFHATKYSRDDLRNVIRDGEPITIVTGEALARWAAGDTVAKPSLSSIITAIKIAENVVQLEAVKPSAGLLTGDDKAKAIEAFKAKQKELAK